MWRWDFVAAYIQGELQRGEVDYCHAPPGHATLGADGRPRICRVEKPMHGMAHAGRRWQRSLFPWLKEWGFRQCESDPCVLTLTRDVGGISQRLIPGCYVDDLFTLHSHSGRGSLYERFASDLAAW
eukprot:1536479-Pleurochrysis_carterae.AAC.5